MMPAAMKMREMMPQMTPQHAEEPPYRWENTEASDSFTLRKMRSSAISNVE